MRTLASINLSDNQKRVLCKTISAPTPKVAAQDIAGSQNLIAARDQLVKVGLLNVNPAGATITDRGQQVLKDAALIDDSGQLTPDGEELAHTDAQGKPVSGQGQQEPPVSDVTGAEMPPADAGGAPPPDMGMGGPPTDQQPPMQMQSDNYERFATLKSLLEWSNGKKKPTSRRAKR